MNKDNFELAAKIVGQNYASAAQNNRRAFEKKVHHFLEQVSISFSKIKTLQFWFYLADF